MELVDPARGRDDLVVGDPAGEVTDLGPLVSGRRLERVAEFVDRARAASGRPSGGFGSSGHGKERSAHSLDDWSRLGHVPVRTR